MTTTNGVDPHREVLKRRWEEKGALYASTAPFYTKFDSGRGAIGAVPAAAGPAPAPPPRKFLGLSPLDDEMASAVVPPVTVVLEGRSICHRVHLHKHASYESLAAALRRMFVDADGGGYGDGSTEERTFDLSNAVPGYMVAYEDMEDDLLLAGDLNWKDFVRVAKRIRILPAKANRRKYC